MHAAWWWIDRWRKSTAYTDFSPEQRGMYRDLLDEVWLRPDHVIPDDDAILGRIVGDPVRWKVHRRAILAKFRRVAGGGWTNDTALQVIHQAERRSDNQRRYRARHGNGPDNGPDNAPDNGPDNAPDNGPDNKPDSPSPSPLSPYSKHASVVSVSIGDELSEPAFLPPADSVERTIRQRTEALRTKLYVLVGELVALDPQERDVTELMQIVTSYTAKDGRAVKGVVNAGLLTYERLEKSIEDAEKALVTWGKGNGES